MVLHELIATLQAMLARPEFSESTEVRVYVNKTLIESNRSFPVTWVGDGVSDKGEPNNSIEIWGE